MIDTKTVKKLSPNELIFARKDLRETIECQELMARAGVATPKLNRYWDELLIVGCELLNRGIR